MKVLATTLLTITALFTLTPAYASAPINKIGTTKIAGTEFQSEEAAFYSGLMKQQQFKGFNSAQLSKNISHVGPYFNAVDNSFKVLDSEVSVIKKANQSGQFVYVPVTTITYGYKFTENS